MLIKTNWLTIETKGKDDVINITDKVAGLIKNEKIKDGMVNVFIHGSTASVTTIEYEPGLIEDIKGLGERLAPAGKTYAHDQAWHDGNGHSHLRASAIGPSLTVPIEDGRMTLGTWQQIVVIDNDIRPRQREIAIQVIGKIA